MKIISSHRLTHRVIKATKNNDKKDCYGKEKVCFLWVSHARRIGINSKNTDPRITTGYFTAGKLLFGNDDLLNRSLPRLNISKPFNRKISPAYTPFRFIPATTR